MKTPTKTDAKAALAILEQAWAYFDAPQKADTAQQPEETYFAYVKAA
ncbi:hypothetical protein [Lacimonas salitolerans]|uniref:Uncharacterized protein n=1 Tax=Lacimonas salitolerans TaxID=1323750 RepID=A0ABW4EI88_9RHOB